MNVLHAGARGLGWAVSAIGLGGFGGALVTAYFAQRERRAKLWLQAGLLTSGGIILLGFVPTISRDVAGALRYRRRNDGAARCDQHADPNALARRVRGRAIAVYTMIAIGVVPAGSLVDGAIAAAIGLSRMFVLAGALCAATFVAIWIFRPVPSEPHSCKEKRAAVFSRLASA